MFPHKLGGNGLRTEHENDSFSSKDWFSTPPKTTKLPHKHEIRLIQVKLNLHEQTQALPYTVCGDDVTPCLKMNITVVTKIKMLHYKIFSNLEKNYQINQISQFFLNYPEFMLKLVLIFAARTLVTHEDPEAMNAGQKSLFDTSQERKLPSGRVKRCSGRCFSSDLLSPESAFSCICMSLSEIAHEALHRI